MTRRAPRSRFARRVALGPALGWAAAYVVGCSLFGGAPCATDGDCPGVVCAADGYCGTTPIEPDPGGDGGRAPTAGL